jgi:hypothetical protein
MSENPSENRLESGSCHLWIETKIVAAKSLVYSRKMTEARGVLAGTPHADASRRELQTTMDTPRVWEVGVVPHLKLGGKFNILFIYYLFI